MKNDLFIDKNNNKFYYLNGALHREDGPAVECSNGYKEWWINGMIHREDGPAIIFPNGRKEWYINGKRHREDGPAIISVRYNDWYYHGQYIDVNSQEEFERAISLLIFD